MFSKIICIYIRFKQNYMNFLDNLFDSYTKYVRANN